MCGGGGCCSGQARRTWRERAAYVLGHVGQLRRQHREHEQVDARGDAGVVEGDAHALREQRLMLLRRAGRDEQLGRRKPGVEQRLHDC